jgi:hypothetical protein
VISKRRKECRIDMYEWYERKRKSVVSVWVSAGEGERERERCVVVGTAEVRPVTRTEQQSQHPPPVQYNRVMKM